jgi:hypothetical protein
MIEVHNPVQKLIDALKSAPNKAQLTQSQLVPLSKEELSLLYEQMLKESMPPAAFNCFKDLFKLPEKHQHFIHLLSKVPLVSQDLLKTTLPLLPEAELFNLIGLVLGNKQFAETQHQILLIFCQHLYNTSDPNAPIHQWPKQNYSKQLVQCLLEDPECLFELAQTYTGFYNLATWSKASDALKYRIDALFNHVELDVSQIKSAASTLLNYSYTQPSKLLTLFTNLQNSADNRTEQGKANYTQFKERCWSLLAPGKVYQEDAFLSLFSRPKLELNPPIKPLVLPGLSEHTVLSIDEQFDYLLNQTASTVPAATIAQFFNTNAAALTSQVFHSKRCLLFMEQCFKNYGKGLIEELHEELMTKILTPVLEQPDLYSQLLEQVLNSRHLKLTCQALQTKLNTLLKQGPQIHHLSQLTKQQLDNLDKSRIPSILAIERLLLLAQPIEELASFVATDKNELEIFRKTVFCADVGLYYLLTNLKKVNPSFATEGINWLIQQCQNTLKTLPELTEQDRVNQPKVFFHWLRWKALLSSSQYNDKNVLVKGFVQWLASTEKEKLPSLSTLRHLLEFVVEQQALLLVLKQVKTLDPPLSTEHNEWLCQNCVELVEGQPDLIAPILELGSWSWLERLLNTKKPNHYNLLKAALNDPAYIKQINASEEQQACVLSRIESNQLSNEQLVDLIKSTSDPQIKSLLIFYLLNQPGYLSSLPGEPLINRLNNDQITSPSRLNVLIHQLDLSVLTKAKIKVLPPEVAVSLLCSIPHFHQLNAELVAQLLGKHTQASVISYWMKHYATMPNAYCVLAHLIACAEKDVYTEFTKASRAFKEAVIHHMLEHLELFNPNNLLLQECIAEDHLALAVRLYLNGHQHASYIKLISTLTAKLIDKNHPFSNQTTQLLILLQERPEFAELSKKGAYLVNYYLKKNAQIGCTDFFYDGGNINTPSLIQPILLKPPYPSPEQTKSLFSHLAIPIFSDEASPITIPHRLHPLVEVLGQQAKLIRAFDYFLIHYKGAPEPLLPVLHAYLSFYDQDHFTAEQHKAANLTCFLITRRELDFKLRDAIHTAILSYPNLHDEQVVNYMFLFNPTKTIQHFGLQGTAAGYQQVIQLCHLAQKKLDSTRHKETINTVQKALFEAQTELGFSQETGFFARLFRRIKRCWIYGWGGFFTPKPPIFVAPYENEIQSKENTSTATEALHTREHHYSPPKDLATLLGELKISATSTKLSEFANYMKNWQPQMAPQDELKLRLSAQELFDQITQASKTNSSLAQWLAANKNSFLANAHRLLELFLCSNLHYEAKILADKLKNESPDLQCFSKEFPLFTLEQSGSMEPQLSASPDVVPSTWGWTNVLSLFTSKTPEVQPAAPSLIKAGL